VAHRQRNQKGFAGVEATVGVDDVEYGAQYLLLKFRRTDIVEQVIDQFAIKLDLPDIGRAGDLQHVIAEFMYDSIEGLGVNAQLFEKRMLFE
jgi:hypothetical protein